MKKFLAVICAVALIMAMSAIAFAAGSPVAALDPNDPFIQQMDEAGVETLGQAAELLKMECPEEHYNDPIIAVYAIKEGDNSFDVKNELPEDYEEIGDFEMAYAPETEEAFDIQALTDTSFDYKAASAGYAFLAQSVEAK